MTLDPFTTSAPQIAASILSADFSKLAAEIQDVLRAGADFLHLDVMDGHLVPNISFGPPIIKSARKATRVFFDAHLMIDEPVRYGEAHVKAGAQNVTFHVEATADPAEAAQRIRSMGTRVGITLKPGTPVEAIFPALDHVDVVLVMSVEPGFGGQKFMPEMLSKVREVRKRLTSQQRIEIDGGIAPQTIRAARDAGVDWFVVGSHIFDCPDRAAAVGELRDALKG